jgi:hypothetical protein
MLKHWQLAAPTPAHLQPLQLAQLASCIDVEHITAALLKAVAPMSSKLEGARIASGTI